MLENNISDIQDTSSTTSKQDEVDRFINSTSNYVNLLKRDGESYVTNSLKTQQRKLATKAFTDFFIYYCKDDGKLSNKIFDTSDASD